MQGMQRSAHWGCCLAVGGLAVVLACSSVQAATAPARSVAIADQIDVNVTLAASRGGSGTAVQQIHHPGASFIKLHFSDFMLPAGVGVVVSSPDGSERYFYSRKKRDAYTWDARQGDDGLTSFSAMSIAGDTAVIRIVGQNHRLRQGRHRVHVDYYLSGHRREESAVPPGSLEAAPGETPSRPQTTCGINERYDAVCWRDSHRPEYERSSAIAVLITAAGEECTAWRVGAGNRLFTAQHCVGSQDDVTGSEIWFNYRATTCGGSSTGTVVKVTGDQFLSADAGLDYGLFTVNDFASISQFGYLGLDLREGSLGEGIFIPQHGLGRPAQIALESDMNASGFCEIDDLDRRAGSDIGYFCDTTTSSSGSPVLAASSGKVIALHHLGGCMNSGVRMKLVWPRVSSHFGGTVPNGDSAWTGGEWGGAGEEEQANLLPDASFTYDCDGLSCTFDGGASEDPDGQIATWTWSLGDGASESGPAVSHTYAAGGRYTVKLTVTDDAGGEDALNRSVSVVAPNAAPAANFSVSCSAVECTFDAGSSTDEDGTITAYDWTLGDGGSASGPVAQHTYAAAGTFTVSLTVTDDDGAIGNRSRSVSVTLPNEAPAADFSWSCTELDCRFDGGASADSDGSITAFAWSFGDGQSAEGVAVSHKFAAAGDYVVKLTVTDDRGATAARNRTISPAMAQSENAAPVAEFTVACTAGNCSFDGRASRDPDGEISSYTWSFGDGRAGSGSRRDHEFAKGGSYEITLTVIDDRGMSAGTSRTIEVEIEPEPDKAPITLHVGESGTGTRTLVLLKWSGAKSPSVDLYRDGVLLARMPNSGLHIDKLRTKSFKKPSYRLCEQSSDFCSSEVGLQ